MKKNIQDTQRVPDFTTNEKYHLDITRVLCDNDTGEISDKDALKQLMELNIKHINDNTFQNKDEPEVRGASQCISCGCMTKTILKKGTYHCEKCKEIKPQFVRFSEEEVSAPKEEKE